MMNYRLSSMTTFKKRQFIGIQSISNKITGLGDDIYYYTEQRSAIVPRDWADRKYWIKLMELLLKLKQLLLEQEALKCLKTNKSVWYQLKCASAAPQVQLASSPIQYIKFITTIQRCWILVQTVSISKLVHVKTQHPITKLFRIRSC
ncbi:unnamed protein product [Absidia cylindrospora]